LSRCCGRNPTSPNAIAHAAIAAAIALASIVLATVAVAPTPIPHCNCQRRHRRIANDIAFYTAVAAVAPVIKTAAFATAFAATLALVAAFTAIVVTAITPAPLSLPFTIAAASANIPAAIVFVDATAATTTATAAIIQFSCPTLFWTCGKRAEKLANLVCETIFIWKNCPMTVTLLLCKLMDNHQTCSTPITSPKQKKVI
jgi:hypothetical protein